MSRIRWQFMRDGSMRVKRTLAEVEQLKESVRRNTRSGGFQNLQRYHLAHLVGTVTIITDPVQIERTIRYNTGYGPGGYQRNTGGRGKYGRKR